MSITDTYEREFLEIFDNQLLCQAICFPTCKHNILDTNFYKNCAVTAGLSQNVLFVYDCSDHQAIQPSVGCPVQAVKSVIEVFHSFGCADFNYINYYLSSNSFQTKCFTNIENTSEELYSFPLLVVNFLYCYEKSIDNPFHLG